MSWKTSLWPLAFVWVRVWVCIMKCCNSFYRWPGWRVCFFCGFFSCGASVQQLLPTFPITDLWPSRENILFHFSGSLVKGLGTLALSSSPCSLTPLMPPPSSPLLLTSDPVRPLTGSEIEGVWLLSEVCVFAFVHVFQCMCTHQCALLSIQSYVCTCLHVTQYVLFKSTVSNALRGSLCIIGDLLLSAHCIWQIWIGDCYADMLINDNHNWYLLISKDEKSSIWEKNKVRIANRHTHFCTHMWLRGWCEFVFDLCHFWHRGGVILINLWWSIMEPAVCQWCHFLCVHISLSVFSCIWTHGEVGSTGDGISNVCDLAHIWTYTLHKGEDSYISTQHTNWSRYTHC